MRHRSPELSGATSFARLRPLSARSRRRQVNPTRVTGAPSRCGPSAGVGIVEGSEDLAHVESHSDHHRGARVGDPPVPRTRGTGRRDGQNLSNGGAPGSSGGAPRSGDGALTPDGGAPGPAGVVPGLADGVPGPGVGVFCPAGEVLGSDGGACCPDRRALPPGWRGFSPGRRSPFPGQRSLEAGSRGLAPGRRSAPPGCGPVGGQRGGVGVICRGGHVPAHPTGMTARRKERSPFSGASFVCGVAGPGLVRLPVRAPAWCGCRCG